MGKRDLKEGTQFTVIADFVGEQEGDLDIKRGEVVTYTQMWYENCFRGYFVKSLKSWGNAK